MRCQAELNELTGYVPSLYRAPLGRSTLSSLVIPRLIGLRQVLWSQDEKDWMLRTSDAATAVGQQLASKVGPGDIVLLHDDNPWVVNVLDVLLPHLKQLNLDLNLAVDTL